MNTVQYYGERNLAWIAEFSHYGPFKLRPLSPLPFVQIMALSLAGTVPMFAWHTWFLNKANKRTHPGLLLFGPDGVAHALLPLLCRITQRCSIKTLNLHLRTLERMQEQYRNELNLIPSCRRYNLHTYWHSCFKGNHKALWDKPKIKKWNNT